MAKQIDKKFIGNDQVDGDKLKLLVGQTIRKDDGAGGSVDVIAALESSTAQVQTNSDAEVARAIAEEALIRSEFAAADVLLQGEISSAISQEVVDRDAAIAAEAALRVSGDESSVLSANAYTDAQIVLAQGDVSAVEAALAQEIIDRAAADDLLIPLSQKGSANGVATLDANGLIPTAQLPSYVDDVLEFADLASFPVTGETGKIYIAIDTNKSYRWSGSIYVYITSGAVDSVNGKTGVVTLDATEISMGDGVTSIESAIQSNVSAIGFETADRIAADAAIQSELTTLTDTVSNADDALQLNIDNEVTRATDEEAAIRGEFAAADALLQGDIDSEVSRAQAEEVSIRADFAAADSALQGSIDAEAARALAAEGALDVRVTALESGVWFKEKFSIANGQTSVTLSFAPKESSMSAFVDRLGIHEGAAEDFTISGAVMTFLNDLVSPGQSQIGNGDTVYVKYQK